MIDINKIVKKKSTEGFNKSALNNRIKRLEKSPTDSNLAKAVNLEKEYKDRFKEARPGGASVIKNPKGPDVGSVMKVARKIVLPSRLTRKSTRKANRR